MIPKEIKEKLIKSFGKSPEDVGSCEVQIALISQRIRQISLHLRVAKKDYSSQRGLTMLIGKRRSFMNYLKRNDEPSYTNLIQALKQQELI